MRGGVRLRITGVLVAVSLLAPPGMQAVCAADGRFIAPVDGPIIRRFEQPLSPYGSGHRGIDFGVDEGAEVVASNDGAVIFAGPVADDGLFVTISHDGPLETTYSFLSEISVTAGEKVRRGDPIGLSGPGHPGEEQPALHFGARIGDHYIDPEILLLRGLDDISELISLAPLDEVSYEEETAVGGSGYLDPVPPAASDGGSWFVRLGERLASWGRAGVRVAAGVGRWIWDRGVDIGRLFGKASDRVGGWLSSAWGAVKSGASAVKGAFDAAARRSGQFLESLWDWTRRGVKTLGGWVADLWRGAVSVTKTLVAWMKQAATTAWRAVRAVAATVTGWARSVARAAFGAISWVAGEVGGLVKWIGGSIKKVADQTVAYRLIPAALEQYRCDREGHPPPRLPDRAELDAGVTPPEAPNNNIVVALAGIGSHTSVNPDGTGDSNAAMYQMDFDTLGYSEDDIYFFSYDGIREGGRGAYRLHDPYSKEDTEQPIELAALKLARQIEEIHRRHPDRKIDILAHSQGGLVAQYYLTRLYDGDNDQGISIDHFITIGTPHHGADAAQLYRRLAVSSQGEAVLDGLDAVAAHFGLPEASSSSARQMAEGSTFLTQLDMAWDPTKVATTTIAATFDLVVTPQKTRLRGARHYTADLPTTFSSTMAHGAVVNANSTREIVYNALSDSPSACTPMRDVVADLGVGRVLSAVQDALILLYAAAVHSTTSLGLPQ